MELCTKTTPAQGYKHARFAWPRGWRMAFIGKGKRVLPVGMNVWVYSLLLVLLLAFPALASLPSSVSVTGSPLAADNNSYVLASSADASGNGYYVTQGGTVEYLYIAYLGSGSAYWAFSSALGNTHPDYYSTSSPYPASTSPVGFSFVAGSGGASTAIAVASGPPPVPTVSSVTASPSSLTGSTSASLSVTVTATLSGAAPTGGATINWTNTTAGGFTGSVGYTAQMTIPQGQTQASETATIGASSSGGSVTFAGQYGSSSQSATVTVGAPAAASSNLPATLYVYGAGKAADNGTYTLINAATPYYTLGGVTSGVGPGIQIDASNKISYVLGAMNYATGTNTATAQPYADYMNNSASPVTSASAYFVYYQSVPAPAPTVSTSPQPGSGGTSTAPGSPGVSASLSPFTVAPGGASVLRWDTSGATTVTVTGVPSPSASGTLNVAPSQTTTYTITATNSAGTTAYPVTLTVDPSLGTAGQGASSFTPGTTVNNGGNSTTTINLPGLTIPDTTLPGLSIPGFPTIPPVTIPGLNLPAITLPALNLPGFNAPGDLKIGIPGLGSIGLPSGWFTQIIAAAINPASIAQQMMTFNMGQVNSLATFDAGQAVKNAVDSGTYTLKQINTVSSEQTQSVISSTSAAVQGTIQAGTTQVTSTINTSEKTAVTDFQGMIGALLQALFIPDPSVLDQFKSEKDQFLNWGPYSFVASFQAVLDAPPGDGMVGGVGLAIPSLDVNADANSSITLDPVTGKITGGAPGFTYFAGSGPPIPFDFQQVTSLPGWAFVRLLLGAGVWIAFIAGVIRVVSPTQVL